MLFPHHTLVLYDLAQELASDGHLGGRNSSFGESEARGSVLEVSRSRTSMSLTSPSLEDGVSWVLEAEISKSLLLRGLLAPSFLAEKLEGKGRGTRLSASDAEGRNLAQHSNTRTPSHSSPVLTQHLSQRAKSTALSHAREEEEGSICLPFIRTRDPPSAILVGETWEEQVVSSLEACGPWRGPQALRSILAAEAGVTQAPLGRKAGPSPWARLSEAQE